MRVEVIIVTFNRPKLLDECLHSLKKAVLCCVEHSFEVSIVFNGDFRGYNLFDPNKYPELNISKELLRQCLNPSEARNVAVKKSDCEQILFLDDDTQITDNYLKQSIEEINDGEFDIYGSRDTQFKNVSLFEEMVGRSIESQLVTFFTRSRHYNVEPEKKVDERHLTLSNLWVKKSVFDQGILFDKKYKRNEENILIQRALEAKLSVGRSRDLFIYHHRRSNLSTFLLPSFWSGYYRAKSLIEYPKFFSKIYLIPAFFVLLGVVGIILNKKILLLHLSYLLTVIFDSIITLMRTRDIYKFPLLTLVKVMIISSYALGQLRYGFEKYIWRKDV